MKKDVFNFFFIFLIFLFFIFFFQILQEEPSKPLSCPIPKFHNTSQYDKRVQCHRMEPSSASCKEAKELYENKQTKQCGLHKEICTLKVSGTVIMISDR